MDGRKITAETFSVEPRDHPEVRCLGQIQRISDRYDRGCQFQFLRFTNRQRRRGLVYFQDGRPAANVCHELVRRIFLAVEFDGEIARFASDSVSGVKCSRRVNEKSGAANWAVFINAVNLDDRFGGTLENVSDLMADCRGGLLLRKEQACA